MKSLRLAAVIAFICVFSLGQSSPIARPDPLSRLHRANAQAGTRHGNPPQQDGLNFAPAVTYNSGGLDTESVVAADVNADGKPDLVVAEDANSQEIGVAGVLLNNGDGTFQPAAIYASGAYAPFSVAVADVNGDGKPDLIVLNQSDSNCVTGSVGVLLGNGDGTFQPAVTYCSGGAGGDDATSIAVADVNGDSKPDLVVLNSYDLVVLLGNGDGTFQTPIVAGGAVGNNASSLTVADVNGDGKPDVLVASCEDSFCSTENIVYVNFGKGDGTFSGEGIYETGGWGGFGGAYSVAVADLNDDGKPDLMVANFCAHSRCSDGGSVGVLLGNGDGTFQTVQPYGSGGADAWSVAAADLNGDGKLDVVVASGGVSVLLGNGDGTFQTAVAYGSGGSFPNSVAIGDLNGDGKPDVAVAERLCDGCKSAVGVLINISVTPTSSALSSSQNPSSFGQSVSLIATVTPQFGEGVPTGLVSFFDGGTNIGNSDLNAAGVATLMISTLSVGTHTITATYNGDTNFAPSTSPVLYQVVQGAVALLSPTGLNFGNQTVGIPSGPQMVALQNTGNINLAITAIQITGQNAGDFSQKNNCPASLPPNNSCQVNVTFKPTAAGIRNASLSVTDNAPGSPQSAPLTGIGVLPAVMFSPSSLTFAPTVVYTTSPPQKLTLTNTGLGILEIKNADISPHFGVTTNCLKTLASGSSCTAEVTFKPTMKGPISGSISITDNAPGSPQQVPLSGTGTFVELTPSSLNFGNQPVNSTSVPKVITLVNKGNGTLDFTGTGITISGADPGDFAQTNSCGTSLASGAHCYIKVTFTPSQQGKRTADVSVSDDGGGSPQVVPLSGTGTP